jgi:hypothetical protein
VLTERAILRTILRPPGALRIEQSKSGFDGILTALQPAVAHERGGLGVGTCKQGRGDSLRRTFSQRRREELASGGRHQTRGASHGCCRSKLRYGEVEEVLRAVLGHNGDELMRVRLVLDALRADLSQC